MKIPEFVVSDKITVWLTHGESHQLEEGYFVQPINPKYVPKHIVELNSNRYYESTHLYCYCRWGIVVIRKDCVRQL